MNSAAILALAAPLLLVQGRRVRRVTPRLPEASGERHGEYEFAAAGDGAAAAERRADARGGGDATPPPRSHDLLRVLIAGDSSAAGVGADHLDEALPGRLVEAIGRRGIARAVRWRVVASGGIDTRGLLDLLESTALDPFDVAVLAIGVNDVTGRRPVAVWLRDLERVEALLRAVSPGALVLASGLPPMHRFPALPQPLRAYLGSRAREFDAALRAWARDRDRVRYIGIPDSSDRSLVASDGFHPGPGAYRIWAGELAGAIAQDGPRASRPTAADPDTRPAAASRRAATAAPPAAGAASTSASSSTQTESP